MGYTKEEIAAMSPLEQMTKVILPALLKRLLTAEERLNALPDGEELAQLRQRVDALEKEIAGLKEAAPKKRAPRKKKGEDAPAPVATAEPAPAPTQLPPTPPVDGALPPEPEPTIMFTYDSDADEFRPIIAYGHELTGETVAMARYALAMCKNNVDEAAAVSQLSAEFVRYAGKLDIEKRRILGAKFPVATQSIAPYLLTE